MANLTDQAQRALTELQRKETLTGCTSYVQRKLQIGFNTADRILEELEDGNYITAPDNNGMRHWGRAALASTEK
jgi:DNA segregation ATPase FtsK/SpoIIIE-like protein